MRYCRLGGTGILLGVMLLAGGGLTNGQAVGKQKTKALKLLLPQADTTVWVDGKKIDGEGAEREIKASALQAGKDSYEVKAQWEPNNYTKITRKRTVPAKDGVITVDLREKDAKQPDDIVVRYVPTPDDIVAAMCKLGKVGKEDVVYDLGCGDGRMVIMAVKDFGAKRGVGVDIDAERVKESKENAKKAGVQDKVAFRKGDVLKIDDLPDASVILLYMGEDINLRLRPILQAKLKPGSRVVSHRFSMGDWKPTKTERVTGKNGGEYTLHLWVIGADEGKKK